MGRSPELVRRLSIPSKFSERLRVSLAAVLRSHRADVYVVVTACESIQPARVRAWHPPVCVCAHVTRGCEAGAGWASRCARHRVAQLANAVVGTPERPRVLEQAGTSLGAAAVFPACDHAHPVKPVAVLGPIPRRAVVGAAITCMRLALWADAWRMAGGPDPGRTSTAGRTTTAAASQVAGLAGILDGRDGCTAFSAERVTPGAPVVHGR